MTTFHHSAPVSKNKSNRFISDSPTVISHISELDFSFHWRRSSHQRWSIKKAALKNFAILIGKHQCWNLFSIKLQAWNPATFLKRDSNIAKLLRTPFSQNTSRRLLLSTIILWHFTTTEATKQLSSPHLLLPKFVPQNRCKLGWLQCLMLQ